MKANCVRYSVFTMSNKIGHKLIYLLCIKLLILNCILFLPACTAGVIQNDVENIVNNTVKVTSVTSSSTVKHASSSVKPTVGTTTSTTTEASRVKNATHTIRSRQSTSLETSAEASRSTTVTSHEKENSITTTPINGATKRLSNNVRITTLLPTAKPTTSSTPITVNRSTRRFVPTSTTQPKLEENTVLANIKSSTSPIKPSTLTSRTATTPSTPHTTENKVHSLSRNTSRYSTAQPNVVSESKTTVKSQAISRRPSLANISILQTDESQIKNNTVLPSLPVGLVKDNRVDDLKKTDKTETVSLANTHQILINKANRTQQIRAQQNELKNINHTEHISSKPNEPINPNHSEQYVSALNAVVAVPAVNNKETTVTESSESTTSSQSSYDELEEYESTVSPGITEDYHFDISRLVVCIMHT